MWHYNLAENSVHDIKVKHKKDPEGDIIFSKYLYNCCGDGK